MLTTEQQAWVDALESDNYQQCKGTINNGYKYCCIGVAACIFNPELLQPSDKEPAYTAVKNKLDLTEYQLQTFIKLNDDKNLTFKQIAAAIRNCNGDFNNLDTVL
jgi:hypothetical protein